MEYKTETRHLESKIEQIAVRLRDGAVGAPNGMPDQIYQDSTVEDAIRNARTSVPMYYALYDGAGLTSQVGYRQNPVNYEDGVQTNVAIPSGREPSKRFVNIDLTSSAMQGVITRSPTKNEALRQEIIDDLDIWVDVDAMNLRKESISQLEGFVHNLYAKQVALIKNGTPMKPRREQEGDQGQLVPKTVHIDARPIMDVNVDDDGDELDFIDTSLIGTGNRIAMMKEIERFRSPSEHGLTGASPVAEFEMTIQGINDQLRNHYVKGAPAPVRTKHLLDIDIFSEFMGEVATMDAEELRTQAPEGEDWSTLERQEMVSRLVRLAVEQQGE